MAEWVLVQDRIVSGTGVLKIPTAANKFRATMLYCDVVRFPLARYHNTNWLPSRGKYAFLTFHRNGYVVDSQPVEFERQVYDGIQDWAGQTLLAVKCAYEGTLISIANLGLALGATPVQYQDLIKDYENLNQSWDEVQIKCYADTAMQFRLYTLQYDVCNTEKDDQRRPSPPPPPTPRVPPGTPIATISLPYNRFNYDGGVTNPYPTDAFPGTPSNCDNVRVYVQYTRVLDGVSSVQTFDFAAKATVDNVYIAEIQQGGSSIFVVDRTGSGNACSPTPVTRRVNRGLGTWSNLSWYAVKT